MKKLVVSLLIALLSLHSIAQESVSDDDVIFTVDPMENQRVSASPSEANELSRSERAQARQAAFNLTFNLRGIELFEQAIADSAMYRMVVVVDGQRTHVESKNIRAERTSGAIARGFAEQMRLANNGQRRTEDGAKLNFKCQQDSALTQIRFFRLFLKPGRCQLTLKTSDGDQHQKVTLSFVMELTDTEEHQNWPTKIISPEILLEIEALNR